MVRVFIPDNTSTTGAGLTGLTSASTNLTIAAIRELTGTAISYTGANIEAQTTIGTYQAPSSSSKCRIKAVDATNFPGLYELQFHDSAAVFDTSDLSQNVIINIYEATTTALKIGPCMVMIPLSAMVVLDGESNIKQWNGTNVNAQGADSIVQHSGTAQGAGTGNNQIQLAASGPSTIDSTYVGSVVKIYGGTGVGQTRTITAYNGTSKTCTVGRNWVTNPSTDSTYAILGLAVPKVDDSLRVDSNLTQILGTSLTETSTGYLTAAFKKLFDVSTPVFTTGETVATSSGQTTILNAVNAITTNTARSGPVMPGPYVRPSSGTNTYRIVLRTWNMQGVPEAPDAAPTIHAKVGATSYDSCLSSTTMTAVDGTTNTFYVTFTVNGADQGSPAPLNAALLVDFAWQIGGVDMNDGAGVVILDEATQATLEAVQSAVITASEYASTAATQATNAASSAASVDGKLPSNTTTILGNIGTPMQSGTKVVLASTQSDYAPAKAGDAMTLTSLYDAAKTAASATAVSGIKTQTDQLTFTVKDNVSLVRSQGIQSSYIF